MQATLADTCNATCSQCNETLGDPLNPLTSVLSCTDSPACSNQTIPYPAHLDEERAGLRRPGPLESSDMAF
jgi:hypothetical protein